MELYNNSGSQAEMESAKQVHGKEGSAENNSMHKEGVTVVMRARGRQVGVRPLREARRQRDLRTRLRVSCGKWLTQW